MTPRDLPEMAVVGEEPGYEAVLRARGWRDEYESETADAMNYGDGYADAMRFRRDRWFYATGVLLGLAFGFLLGWMVK